MFLEGGEALSRKEVWKKLQKFPGVLTLKKRTYDGTTGWEIGIRYPAVEARLQTFAVFLGAHKGNGSKVQMGLGEKNIVKKRKQKFPRICRRV